MLERYRYPCEETHFPMNEYSLKQRDEFEKIRNDLVDLNCLVCDHDQFTEIGQVDRYGFYYPTGVCQKCGNLQQIQYYNEEALALFYSKYFRDVYSNDTPKACFQGQSGKGLRIYDFTKGFIPEKADVLEIGTGAGGILKAFRDEGHKVLGIDFDERYIKYGNEQGIEIRQGGFDVIEPERKFDLIIISHVLEHVVDMFEFIKQVKLLLKNGARVYIEVPSLDNLAKGGYNYDFLNYFQNSHVIHFSVDSLFRLLRNNGLKAIHHDDFICCVCEIDETSLQNGADDFRSSYLKQLKLIQTIERKRKSFFRRLIRKIKSIFKK
ncbi:MAG: class I SAM-dependent methyltransferase [Methylocystaceae bacterium]|nr:class I SAM-dependent methyltransferase [Methylocystaceae bacterium]